MYMQTRPGNLVGAMPYQYCAGRERRQRGPTDGDRDGPTKAVIGHT